jgi:ABC-type sugar transport system ATPase subunit
MLSGDSNQAALLKDKRIRIITISEIRYEGRLYQINSKEKTIALKDVVTYGTEDRRTDTVVPPQQTVYEMIIFKASHIKDLNVLTQEEENKVQVVKKEEEVSAKLPKRT